MLTNEEMQVLDELIEYLDNFNSSKSIYFSNELIKIYERIRNNKKIQNVKSNEYNKNNKKYHTLINSLSYHRKRGNQAKVKELEEKLNEYKNRTI